VLNLLLKVSATLPFSEDFRRPPIPQSNHSVARILRFNHGCNLLPIRRRPEPLNNLKCHLLVERRDPFHAAVAPVAVREYLSILRFNLLMRHILKRDLIAAGVAIPEMGNINSMPMLPTSSDIEAMAASSMVTHWRETLVS
jgi:hypothetical protein